jgi:hypothetical protein
MAAADGARHVRAASRVGLDLRAGQDRVDSEGRERLVRKAAVLGDADAECGDGARRPPPPAPA